MLSMPGDNAATVVELPEPAAPDQPGKIAQAEAALAEALRERGRLRKRRDELSLQLGQLQAPERADDPEVQAARPATRAAIKAVNRRLDLQEGEITKARRRIRELEEERDGLAAAIEADRRAYERYFPHIERMREAAGMMKEITKSCFLPNDIERAWRLIGAFAERVDGYRIGLERARQRLAEY
jgi:chromosome segregation ATPase